MRFEGCDVNIWVEQELDMVMDEFTLRQYSVVLVIAETLDNCSDEQQVNFMWSLVS